VAGQWEGVDSLVDCTVTVGGILTHAKVGIGVVWWSRQEASMPPKIGALLVGRQQGNGRGGLRGGD
jgi:hypothetical protein